MDMNRGFVVILLLVLDSKATLLFNRLFSLVLLSGQLMSR